MEIIKVNNIMHQIMNSVDGYKNRIYSQQYFTEMEDKSIKKLQTETETNREKVINSEDHRRHVDQSKRSNKFNWNHRKR